MGRLRRFLANDYTVISISLEDWGNESFATEENFCQDFLEDMVGALELIDELP